MFVHCLFPTVRCLWYVLIHILQSMLIPFWPSETWNYIFVIYGKIKFHLSSRLTLLIKQIHLMRSQVQLWNVLGLFSNAGINLYLNGKCKFMASDGIHFYLWTGSDFSLATVGHDIQFLENYHCDTVKWSKQPEIMVSEASRYKDKVSCTVEHAIVILGSRLLQSHSVKSQRLNPGPSCSEAKSLT